MLKKVLFASFSFALLIGCQNAETTGSDDNSEASDTTAMEEKEPMSPNHYEKNGIKLYPKGEIAEFPQASLMNNVKEFKANDKGELTFDFAVQNYQLGAQTDEARLGLANSDKGQHIHLIVDNGPYSAHYEPKFNMSFPEGQHYAIAFLSRSYHESVKNDQAAVVFQFNSGKSKAEPFQLDGPLLFYSRPKGTYSGEAAQKILFDFYLSNAELSSGGHRVKMTVNGNTEFMIDQWQPYIIEGLPMGENTIEISLIDENGNAVNPDMNTVSRSFTLEQ